MSDFLMPKLGTDMTEGKLVAWCKAPGDTVHRGDILAQVDTDKGVIDVESFADGVLEALVAQPGDIVPVGSVLAHLRSADAVPIAASPAVPLAADSPSASDAGSLAATATSSSAGSKSDAAPSLQAAETLRVRISPSARKLASELGVDVSSVVGSGPDGAITREDIQRADIRRSGPIGTLAEASPPATVGVSPVSTPKSLESVDRNARMRSAIAAAMTRSNREIPHYYLSTTIDFKKVLDWLTQQNDRRKVTDRLLYGVILLKATAIALREVPELNAFWQDEQLQVQSSVHLGVAISLRGGGLVAPALHDVDRKSMDELMADFRDLVQRARTGKLRSSELSNQTITVTSLGEQGVESVFGVIYPPQVALVGFGKVVERPWCVDGQVIPRPLLTATLAGDHRATDGHRGGVFLAVLDRLLQEPDKL